jgi:uncharacterized protein
MFMPLESQYSAQVSAMATDGLAPAQVIGLQFTVEQGKVRLSWDPVTTSASFTDQFTGDGTETTFQLTYLDVAAGSYTVKVDGVDQTEGTDYTIDLVNGVVTFTTAPADQADIEVTYRQNLSDLAGYKIFRKHPSEGAFTAIGNVASTIGSQTTTYEDTTMHDGSTYDYAVAAFDDEETPNEGQKSATVQVKTVPSVPTGLTATAYDKKIVLRWQSVKDAGIPEKNENLAGYKIYRSETDGSGYVSIGMASHTETEFEDTSVENGRTYYYVITAVDNS